MLKVKLDCIGNIVVSGFGLEPIAFVLENLGAFAVGK